MIDYDKLKLVHELAEKLKTEDWSIKYGYYNGNGYFVLTFYDFEDMFHEYEHSNIDDLVSKLQELTGELKPKYKVGQEVWLIDDSEICTALIDKYDDREYFLRKCTQVESGMATGKGWIAEDKVYPSREDLIEAQIDYWNKLRYPDINDSAIRAHAAVKEDLGKIVDCDKRIFDVVKECIAKECQHESDGMLFEMPPYSHKYKCIKCGVFYK
jgi:hypothetical protein